MNNQKNIVIVIDCVDKGLVNAVKKIENKLGYKLKPIALVSKKFSLLDEYKNSDRTYFKEIICDFDDLSELQKTLKPIQDKILVSCCRYEAAMSDYAKAIPFMPYISTPTESSLLWSTEKKFMRDRLRDFDDSLIPKYKHLKVFNSIEIDDIIKNFTFPVIVKPNGLRLSLLVTKCDTPNELSTILANTFNLIAGVYKKEGGVGVPSVLVEEFIVGELYSIDAYIKPDGEVYCMPPIRTVTANDKGLEGFYGCEFILPVQLNKQEVSKAYETAILSIKALNLRACSAHVELYRCNDGKWKIVELGPRLGGHRDELYFGAYGVDHFYNDLAFRIGLPLEIPKPTGEFISCMGIYPETEGVIKSINNLSDAGKLEGVVSIDAKMNPGDRAVFAQNGGKSAVHASLVSDSIENLTLLIEKVRNIVNIDTE